MPSKQTQNANVQSVEAEPISEQIIGMLDTLYLLKTKTEMLGISLIRRVIRKIY